MIWLFWSCAALFAWVYIGYPAVLAVWSRTRPVVAGDPAHRPTVSVIIAAWNETDWIEARISNLLETHYPHDHLQVIVVSDGSDDGTTEKARAFDNERLLVIEVQPRAGKASALNRGLARATGEIVVFSDANVLFDDDAIAHLAAHFADPDCGAVTGRVELLALESDEPLGEGVYMRVERFLHARESRVATVVGVDGALFAARRALIPALPVGLILDDFYIAMSIAGHGWSVRYEERAHGMERVPASVAQEFRRKVRIAAGCFQVLPLLTFLRHPWRWPALWFCFVSHKLLRWLTPAWMAGMLVSSAALATTPFWLMVLGAQAVAYGLAFVGWRMPVSRQHTAVYVPYYFTALNIAFALGLWRHFRGGQSATWQRVDRNGVREG